MQTSSVVFGTSPAVVLFIVGTKVCKIIEMYKFCFVKIAFEGISYFCCEL